MKNPKGDIVAKRPWWANPRPITVPKKAHPMVQFLFQKCILKNYSLTAICREAGVNRNTVTEWKKGSEPSVVKLDAMLKVIGYTLVPISLEYREVLMRKAKGNKGPTTRPPTDDDNEWDQEAEEAAFAQGTYES